MPDPTSDLSSMTPVPPPHDEPAEAPVERPVPAPASSGAEGRVDGRQRLRTALMRPSRGQAIVAVLLAAVGFAAVTQVRTNDLDNSYAGYREQDLIDVLNGLSGTSQRAQAEIARLESTRRDLQSTTRRREAALAQAQQESDTLSLLAGLVPATGPGIRITVTEGDRQVDVESMLDTIEELRSADAEALQVNGKVRLVAQSSVEDGVGGIVFDGTLLHSPYVIDAIGDPHTLAGAMSFRQGPTSQFHDDGAQVKVQQLDSLDIQAVREPDQPQYAQPQ